VEEIANFVVGNLKEALTNAYLKLRYLTLDESAVLMFFVGKSDRDRSCRKSSTFMLHLLRTSLLNFFSFNFDPGLHSHVR
jgi:hypothetical protein